MAERYPAHPAYEDSGIPSCTMRPHHWGITRLKFISELNPSKSEVRHLDPQTAVTFLPMEAIGENGELDVSRERALQDVRNGYTFLGEGDVCIAKITPCFENGKGAVISGTRTGVAFATTEVIPFRCKRGNDARFLYFLLTSAPFKPDAEASMYGAGGQKRVADSFAGNYSAVLPPPVERSQIAKFLDYETAKIDALIEKQQQLIALLKEKRQAVISTAVTRGLNPDAPMRDSGVGWLGEVPAHWEVCRAKHVASVFVPQRNKPELNDEDGLPWITMDDMRVEEITQGRLFVSEAAAVGAGSRILPAGAVIASCVGNFGICAINRIDVVINQQLQAFLPERIDPSYLAALVEVSVTYFEMVGTAATLVYVNQQGFDEMPALVPPSDEQKAICEHLSSETKRIGTATEKATEIVLLLQERRTALISAAVTGKVDVRGWNAPNFEMAEVVV